MRRLGSAWALSFLLAGAGTAATLPEGLALKKQGKHAEAAKVFEALVKKNPKDVESLEQLATLQGWLNRYDESIATWKRALALKPKNRDYRVGLARVLYWKHEFKDSLRELDAVLEAKEDDLEALILEGDVYLADGKAAAARKSYRSAQELAPDDAELAKKAARAVDKAPSK